MENTKNKLINFYEEKSKLINTGLIFSMIFLLSYFSNFLFFFLLERNMLIFLSEGMTFCLFIIFFVINFLINSPMIFLYNFSFKSIPVFSGGFNGVIGLIPTLSFPGIIIGILFWFIVGFSLSFLKSLLFRDKKY